MRLEKKIILTENEANVIIKFLDIIESLEIKNTDIVNLMEAISMIDDSYLDCIIEIEK